MPPGRFRVRRFLFWSLLVLAGAYLVWGRVEAAGLSREIAQIKQRREPIEVEEFQTPPRTREQRQAVQAYVAAAERLQEFGRENGSRFYRLDVDKLGPSPNLDELEATYRRDAPPLQLLDQATPLDFVGFGTLAPELAENQSPLELLGALNDLRADLLSRRGRGDEAAGVLVGSVRLLRTMPISSYQYQANSRLLGSLRVMLRRTSPGDVSLTTLQRAFEQLPDEDGMVRDAMLARAQFLQRLEAPRRTVGEAFLLAAFHPAVSHFARRQLAGFDDTIAAARQPWPAKLEAVEALTRRYPDPSQWGDRGWLRNLIELGPPSLALMALAPRIAGLNVATRRVAIAVLAAERYRRAHAGAPPPGLDALVPAFMSAVPQDPFSGKPLVYKTDPDSYIIYSVDTNRIDDGGVLYGPGVMPTPVLPGPRPALDRGIRVPLRPVQ